MPYIGVMSEKSSIFILPALLSPIFMSIKTIGRIVDGCVAAIVCGSAHLAADHNLVASSYKT